MVYLGSNDSSPVELCELLCGVSQTMAIDFLVMFSKQRGWPLHFPGRFGEFAWGTWVFQFACHGVFHFYEILAHFEMFVFDHVLHVLDGAERYPLLEAHAVYLILGVRRQPRRQEAVHLIGMFEAYFASILESGIIGIPTWHLTVPDKFQKPLPLIALDGNHTHETVLAGQDGIGVDSRGAMSPPHAFHSGHNEGRFLVASVQSSPDLSFGDVNLLPLAGYLCCKAGCHGGGGTCRTAL